MENSCWKKYRMSSKKWILASSYPKFRRNSALIPANAGLFHYAGNNPIRYIDPTGMYEQDHEDKVYSFDIRNKSDFDDVASIMMDKQREGYVARGYDSNTGNYLEFNSYSGMLKFSAGTKEPASLEDLLAQVNSFADKISKTLTAAYMNSAMSLDQTGKYSSFRNMKTFEKWGIPFTMYSVGNSVASGFINFIEKDYYGLAENFYDLGLTAIGYYGGPVGCVVSLELDYIRRGVKFAANELAKYKIYQERKILNNTSQFWFGINVK